jgi:hypothetical protein
MKDYWDSFWSLRGLLDGAALLDAAGMAEQAEQARGWAGELSASIDASLDVVASRLGTAAMRGSRDAASSAAHPVPQDDKHRRWRAGTSSNDSRCPGRSKSRPSLQARKAHPAGCARG